MYLRHSPYAPGAGTPPPELAGRQTVLQQASDVIERTRLGYSSKSILMVGLRGVGKTVLLEHMSIEAEDRDVVTIRFEAPENRSLPSILAPQLRTALLSLSANERAKELALRAIRGLAGFVRALKVKYHDIEVGLEVDPVPGLADNGDLELDLQALMQAVGEAAQAGNTAFAIFADELQYVKEEELAALITALHRTAQRKLPVVMVGAGLPQMRGRMGNAKSYAERLFDFPQIGPLSSQDAREALAKPAQRLGVEFEDDALELVVLQTGGYPYFLQEWGKHVWETAEASPITVASVEAASQRAIASLDESFFLVRFDRLTPSEKRYLRAMAALGEGPHRSGDIANELGRAVNELAPVRSRLTNKGMVWSPGHGDTAFTVPMFDQFMVRIMPGDTWW